MRLRGGQVADGSPDGDGSGPPGSLVAFGPRAGLAPRVAAFVLDYLPIAAYLVVLLAVGMTVGRAFPLAIEVAFAQAARAQTIGFVLITLPVGLYFALLEASAWRATWGKRRLGLVVAEADGGRLCLGRSLARTGLKFVPWELAHAAVWGITLEGGDPGPAQLVLLAGVWLLVGANAVGIGLWRRALYDVVVGTFVVRARASA